MKRTKPDPNKATKQDLTSDREITATTILLVRSCLEEGLNAETIAEMTSRDVGVVEALISLGEKRGWDEIVIALNKSLKRMPKEGYRK